MTEVSSERLADKDGEVWPPIIDLGRVLGFFASVIKSGEPWTETCQIEYDKANSALQSIYSAKEAEVTVTDEMVERAMGAFIEEVRRQDGEWTDDFDEERLLTSPSGDWFAPFFPIRAALVAALSRKG